MRCSVEGCERFPKMSVAGIHLCGVHYEKMKPTPCSVEGCGNKSVTAGLCNAHYHRKKKGQRVAPAVRKRNFSPYEDSRLLACGLTPWTKRHEGEESPLMRLAEELGRSYQACLDRLGKLQKRAPHQRWTEEGLWTEEEDEFIRSHIGFPETPKGTWPLVSAYLGRTYQAVCQRASKLRKEMQESALDE